MKVTIKKTTFFMALLLAGVAYVIFISVLRVMAMPFNPPVPWGTVIAVLINAIYASAIFYLICIIKFKGEKKIIMFSLLLFLCMTAIFSVVFTASFKNTMLLMPLSVINVGIMLNMVVQIFRITDATLSTPFKLWGISLVFKLAVQLALPLVFGYLADNLSLNFDILSYITVVLEILSMLIIVFIFVRVLQDLKSQQNMQIKAGLSEIYLSGNLDKTEQW